MIEATTAPGRNGREAFVRERYSAAARARWMQAGRPLHWWRHSDSIAAAPTIAIRGRQSGKNTTSRQNRRAPVSMVATAANANRHPHHNSARQ